MPKSVSSVTAVHTSTLIDANAGAAERERGGGGLMDEDVLRGGVSRSLSALILSHVEEGKVNQ